MVCAGARCLCKRSSFEASCVPCWFIVYIVLPSNLYFYKYPSINDSGYLLSPCVHWCWYTCAFSIAPIRLDLDAFFVLNFWLCSVLYNLLCCLHIGNGLIIQILRHRDLNYTERSFWADQAEPNSSRVFGADQVDAISIQDFTLASAGTGIHAVSNDKYITYLVKVYQKSYAEKYEHLLCSD